MIEVPKRQGMITEEKILTPLAEVLNEVTPQLQQKTSTVAPSKALTQSLNDLFPEQQFEDKRIQRAKEILGDQVKDFSSEELRDLVAQVQYLVESWLDDFERGIFKGLTLKELLHERGGV